MATTGRPTGRPPKPVEQKRALGNQGHRPLPDPPTAGQGLKGSSSIPKPPALGLDGTEMWNRVWSAGRQWLSPESDYVLIAMLCQAQDEAEEIRRVLAIGAEKRYYTIANGQQVTSPLVKQLKELRIQITGWLASLGYSPTDRARLGLGEVRHSDALDELNRKRAERMKAVNE